MFPIDYRTLSCAFITWLLPLFLSFGLFDPDTQTYVPSFAGFKVIMTLTSAAVTFFTYRWIARDRSLVWGMAAEYLAVHTRRACPDYAFQSTNRDLANDDIADLYPRVFCNHGLFLATRAADQGR